MAENNTNDLLGGGIASLLSNPEITAKLPRIMEALAPVMAEMQGAAAPPDASAGTEATAANADAPPAPPDAMLTKLLSGATKPRESSARRIALLKALEPYLSDSRREAMEYICKVSGLLDILSEVM